MSIIPFDVAKLILYPDGKTYNENTISINKIINKDLRDFFQIFNFINRYWDSTYKNPTIVIVGYDGNYMNMILKCFADIPDSDISFHIYSNESYQYADNIFYYDLDENIVKYLYSYVDKDNVFLIMNNFYDKDLFQDQKEFNERMDEQMRLVKDVKPVFSHLKFYNMNVGKMDYINGRLMFQPFDEGKSEFLSIISSRDELTDAIEYDLDNIFYQSEYFNNVSRETNWCDPYSMNPIEAIDLNLKMRKELDYVLFAQSIMDYAAKFGIKYETKDVYRKALKYFYENIMK